MKIKLIKHYFNAIALVAGLTLSAQSMASPFTFATADLLLPATSGNGLTGQLWINVDPGTDTLAQADAIIAGGLASANFLSTTVDYPSGPAGSALVSSTYATVLDAIGIATIDNASVLTDDVLNTVMRFSGFFAANAGETWDFSVLSDDGSAVDIQGTRILNNDGIHGFGGPTTEVTFGSTGLYALDVIFFESQANHFGLEFRGGLNGATPTTAISDRLYNLIDFADEDDDRLDTVASVPEPSALLLLSLALMTLAIPRRRMRVTTST